MQSKALTTALWAHSCGGEALYEPLPPPSARKHTGSEGAVGQLSVGWRVLNQGVLSLLKQVRSIVTPW